MMRAQPEGEAAGGGPGGGGPNWATTVVANKARRTNIIMIEADYLLYHSLMGTLGSITYDPGAG